MLPHYKQPLFLAGNNDHNFSKVKTKLGGIWKYITFKLELFCSVFSAQSLLCAKRPATSIEMTSARPRNMGALRRGCSTLTTYPCPPYDLWRPLKTNQTICQRQKCVKLRLCWDYICACVLVRFRAELWFGENAGILLQPLPTFVAAQSPLTLLFLGQQCNI